MPRVLLVEDHNIVRSGIKMLLETDESISIVAEATNGKDAIDFLEKGNRVDIVITDINMPELDGIALTKLITELFPQIKIIILSMHDNDKYVFEAFLEGAFGYLLKNISAEELLFALKHINNGNKYLCSELTLKMLNKVMHNGYPVAATISSPIEFSIREVEVLHLIAEGLTNVEIANKLFVSKRTIEGHRQSLIEKTGVKNTAALIRYAVLHGIIQ